jgi:hypothetical protein
MQRALRQPSQNGEVDAGAFLREPIEAPDAYATIEIERRRAADRERLKDLELAGYDDARPPKTFAEMLAVSLRRPTAPPGPEPTIPASTES